VSALIVLRSWPGYGPSASGAARWPAGTMGHRRRNELRGEDEESLARGSHHQVPSAAPVSRARTTTERERTFSLLAQVGRGVARGCGGLAYVPVRCSPHADRRLYGVCPGGWVRRKSSVTDKLIYGGWKIGSGVQGVRNAVRNQCSEKPATERGSGA
jgi:hypothetical protein